MLDAVDRQRRAATTIISNNVYAGFLPASGTVLRFYSLDIAANASIIHYSTFEAASDGRLKDDVQDVHAEACQNILTQVDVKTYTIKDHDDGLHRLGFIAQSYKRRSFRMGSSRT